MRSPSRNIALEGREPLLQDVLADPSTADHIRDAIARAPLHLEPFPHAVVERVLPDALYRAAIEGRPPVELFADRPPNKQQLLVPFHLAPTYSRRVWQFLADVVVRDVVTRGRWQV